MDVAILMGADPEAAKDEMMEVLKFEMAIANISLPRWAIIIYFFKYCICSYSIHVQPLNAWSLVTHPSANSGPIVAFLRKLVFQTWYTV